MLNYFSTCEAALVPDLPSLFIRRRRAWLVALALLLVAFAGIGLVKDAPRNASSTDALPVGADSTTVVELLDRFPQSEDSTAVVLYTADGGTLDNVTVAALDRAFSQRVAASAAASAGTAPSPPAPGAPTAGPSALQVSADRKAAHGVLPVAGESASDLAATVQTLRTQLREQAPQGVTVQVTGPAAIQADLAGVFDGANERLLLATASVVALLLLVTYRSPTLWVVPLVVVGIADRLAAVLATRVLAATGVPWDESTIGILSVLVFGAGTNYALLLISRYRDELRVTADRYAAMRRALRHAGEAVLVSATTVVLALLTLLLSVFPSTRGLGLASAVGIVVAAGYALVVLPAVLVLFGRWIFWPLVPRVGQAALGDSRSPWRRIGDRVAARPVAVAVGVCVVLGAMAAGLPQVQTGLSTSDQFLRKPEAIVAADRLAQSFPAGSSDPLVVVTEGSGPEVSRLAGAVPGVARAVPSRSADGLTEVQVVLATDPGSAASTQAVRDVRAALAPVPGTYVGGTEAQALDSQDAAGRDRLLLLPLILALVLGTLLLLLRAVVAPLILVVTVVATYLAAVGASWWLFSGVLGFSGVDVSAPLLTFLFLVALGVDYNIFLVTRAREEAARHGVREGMLRALAATGGVITSAGILLAAVFAVLGVLPLVVLAQVGVIICIGVLLDTLLVRTLLVPALALLLGDRFWWPRKVTRRQAQAAKRPGRHRAVPV